MPVINYEVMTLKLAEALQERVDLNVRIESLKSRLYNNAIYQEGESPAENPDELLRELDECLSRLRELIARINRTNCETVINGATITEMIASRDVLKVQLAAYRDLVGAASQIARRASRTEIKLIPAVDVRAIQKKADELAKELRVTDNAIQEANWITELK
jgi:hypothetical protein